MIVSYKNMSAFYEPKSLHFGLQEDDIININSSLVKIQTINKSPKYLERLVLNIANICNLNCSYCYALGGDYGGPHEQMLQEIGRLAIEKFFTTYEEIETIQFFGGEPLLNWKGLDLLCQHCYVTADRLGKNRPVLMISTNGTILNDDIIRIIKEYDIKVTVSLDGPPEVTNKLRPTRNGSVTSDIVVRNIHRMLNETGQPSQIEGTFTETHIQLGISVVDVMEYISEEFQIPLIHMPINVLPSSLSKKTGNNVENIQETLIHMYSDALLHSVDSILNYKFGTKTILGNALDLITELVNPQTQEKPVICPAGTGTIAVDSNGDIYPCFMFYRKKQFLLGSVNREIDIHNNKINHDFIEKLSRNNPSQKYYSSWARRFFMGCAGGNYFKNGDHEIVSDFEVSLVESMASAAIIKLANLKHDEEEKFFSFPQVLQLFKIFTNVPALG